jgi:hypothetical protein
MNINPYYDGNQIISTTTIIPNPTYTTTTSIYPSMVSSSLVAQSVTKESLKQTLQEALKGKISSRREIDVILDELEVEILLEE